jgi:hypothetical protein
MHRILQRFPKGLLALAFCFALLGLILVAPISYIPYVLLGIDGMSGQNYAIVKGVWAGIMAAVMVVPMIQLGLASSAPTSASTEGAAP